MKITSFVTLILGLILCAVSAEEAGNDSGGNGCGPGVDGWKTIRLICGKEKDAVNHGRWVSCVNHEVNKALESDMFNTKEEALAWAHTIRQWAAQHHGGDEAGCGGGGEDEGHDGGMRRRYLRN